MGTHSTLFIPHVSEEITSRFSTNQIPDFVSDYFKNHSQIDLVDLSPHINIDETIFLTIGGGIGSFCWADYLSISGVPQHAIRAIGFNAKPFGRYQQLCRNSQIPDHERLRSNSDACPDNIWGWPGYAVREMWQDAKQGQFFHLLQTATTLSWEPFIETYTPKASAVYESMEREAQRIGWDQIWRQGRVRSIRKTTDGRYGVLYSQSQPNGENLRRVMVCNYLHLAVGYPRVRFLADLQQYRTVSGDMSRVVNAYENHDHLYQSLAKNSGTIMLRGRGIVASRILQRIWEVREESGQDIKVIHLMRTRNEQGKKFRHSERHVAHHWEYQPFNWPKAAFSGELRDMLANASNDERKQLLENWGGTTTADREDWQKIIEAGLREGWYEIQFGSVAKVTHLHDSGRLGTILNLNGGNGPPALTKDGFYFRLHRVRCRHFQQPFTQRPHSNLSAHSKSTRAL